MGAKKRKMKRLNDPDKIKKNSKMEAWIKALTKVLKKKNLFFLTDKDLLFLVNKELTPTQQISLPTFNNWKAGKHHANEDYGKQFIELIEESLIVQKQIIEEKMFEDDGKNWQRYAWLMERKFSEWNLKHISENINRNEQATIIQITAGSDEQKKLIESIMNDAFEEIKPKQIEAPKQIINDNNDDNELPF